MNELEKDIELKKRRKLHRILIVENILLVIILLLHLFFVCHCGCNFRQTLASNYSTPFTVGKVDITLNDDNSDAGYISPNDTINRTVSVTNNADSQKAYVRIKLEKQWVVPDNYNGPELNSDLIIINFTNTADWIKIGDYYYYKKVLPEGRNTTDVGQRTTSTLFESYTLDEAVNNSYSGIKGDIQVTAEAIQSSAISEAWGINADVFN